MKFKVLWTSEAEDELAELCSNQVIETRLPQPPLRSTNKWPQIPWDSVSLDRASNESVSNRP